MKGKKALAILLIIFSAILVVGVSIACGFYKQIVVTGFIPDALLFTCFMLSFCGIGGGCIILISGSDSL